MVSRFVGLGILVLASIDPVLAGESLSVADVTGLRRVMDPQISPDGEWVVYVVSAPQRTGKPDTDLWWVSADGGPARQLTHDPGLDDSPRISPDGAWIAFRSRRPDETAKVQIHLLPTAGGEARALTSEPEDVADLAWSPDGSRLAYSVMAAETPAGAARRAAGRDQVDSAVRRHRLLKVIGLAGGPARILSDPDRSVFDFAWAPDGERLAAFTASDPGPGQGYWNATLELVDAKGGGRSPLFSGGSAGKIQFSPDGRTLAVLGAPGQRFGHPCPALVPVDGGPVRVLAPDIQATTWDFAWRPDGGSLIVWGHQGTRGFLGSLPALPAKGGTLTTWYPLSLRAWGNPALSISADGRWLALLAEHPRHPPEVFLASLAGKPLPPRRLTHTNPHLERLELGRVEEISWRAPDGLEIGGVLVHPAGRPRAGAAALVVMVHGGPQWQYWYGFLGNWHEPAQWLAARGYRVLLPNPRGSTGRGSRFARRAIGDWGGADLADVLAGADALVAQGRADPDRLAIVGWSYGGYLTARAITRTDRFKAAMAGAAVTDLMSMHGTSDIPPFLPEQFGASPFEKPAKFLERSPVFAAHRARTPTLIVHGQQDVRVPVGQAHELHQALREAGVEVRLLVFPREGHHFQEVAHQAVFLEEMAAWLEQHVPPVD